MARAIRQIDYSLPIDIGGEVIENDEPLSGIIDSAAEMHSLTNPPFSPSSNVPPDVTTAHRTAYAIEINRPYFASFGAVDAASFSKRGSFRSGSNIGSSRSSAGVSGVATGLTYGIERSFFKAAMARSGSPTRAATRARMLIGPGPETASFSIGFVAMARSDRANAAALSPRPIWSARDLQ